jgi:hypothetical protein
MNKKGQVGLDTAKAVMLTILIVGVIAFVAILALSNLGNTNAARTSSGVITVVNETLTTVTETGENLVIATRPDVICTLGIIVNQSNTAVIPAANFTQANCNLAHLGGGQAFNNTNWNVSYTYTYNTFGDVESNITTGTASFFNNSNTWFALLSVVVIILIISIVIFAVNRFGGGVNRSSGEASL